MRVFSAATLDPGTDTPLRLFLNDDCNESYIFTADLAVVPVLKTWLREHDLVAPGTGNLHFAPSRVWDSVVKRHVSADGWKTILQAYQELTRDVPAWEGASLVLSSGSSDVRRVTGVGGRDGSDVLGVDSDHNSGIDVVAIDSGNDSGNDSGKHCDNDADRVGGSSGRSGSTNSSSCSDSEGGAEDLCQLVLILGSSPCLRFLLPRPFQPSISPKPTR